jgi:hypothetical protein
LEIVSLPEWLTTALVAAALATLGFVGKQVLEWIVALRAVRRVRRAKLVTLLSLLNGSAAVYRVQAILRNNLLKSLMQRSPDLKSSGPGYESIFSAAFPTLTDEERKLHTMIRGYTVNGLKPLNEAMVQWLQADTEFKLARSRKRNLRALARKLSALEPHLLMWLAKYAAWIPETPSHALVYLGDEEGHGVPFPKHIENTIEVVLGLRMEPLAPLLKRTATPHALAEDRVTRHE